MRKMIQALSLLLFTAFFLLATYRLPDWLPADIYLRIDPLLGINAVIASREIIGRALCSLVLIGARMSVRFAPVSTASTSFFSGNAGVRI
jgi:hypothetical protein